MNKFKPLLSIITGGILTLPLLADDSSITPPGVGVPEDLTLKWNIC